MPRPYVMTREDATAAEGGGVWRFYRFYDDGFDHIYTIAARIVPNTTCSVVTLHKTRVSFPQNN